MREPTRAELTCATQRWAAVGPAVGSAAVLMVATAWIGRRSWFFSDEWNIFAYYHDGRLLEPFNGHLSLVPAGLYQLLFHTLGVGSYWPYRALGLASLVTLSFQTIRYARSRTGLASYRTAAVIALIGVSAILWNPSGSMVLLFPFLMNFTLPIAALPAIWWHLDRQRPRNDLAAGVWLAIALATSGLGVVVFVAVAVELAVTRTPLARAAMLAPGPLLWVVWFVTHRDAGPVSTDVPTIAGYSARMLLGAATTFAGGWRPGGWLVTVALVGATARTAARRRSIDARLVAAGVAPLVFIVLTAVTRLDVVPYIPPDEPRYVWAVAAMLVLASLNMVGAGATQRSAPAQLIMDTPLARRWPLPLGVAVIVVVVAIGGSRLVPRMYAWAGMVEAASPGLRSIAFATEAVGAERIDPDRVIEVSLVPVTAGAYLAAVGSVGSPIDGMHPLVLGGAADARGFADRILVEELPIRLSALDPGVFLGPDHEGDPAPAYSGERCDNWRTGDDGPIEAQPGEDVLVGVVRPVGARRVGSERGAATKVEIPITRIGPPGSPPVVTGTLESAGIIRIPLDAPSAPRVDRPYRLNVPAGVMMARCRS